MASAVSDVSDPASVPVQYVKGVGPRRAKVLVENGIKTVLDLLYYVPRAYLDRRHVLEIGALNHYLDADHDVTVVGEVKSFSVVGHGAKSRFILILGDDTGSVQCVWFQGLRYYQKAFHVGERLAISGRVTEFGGRLQFQHPEFDRLSVDEEDDGGINWDVLYHTGGIIPLYPSGENLRRVGLDSRGFRRILRHALAEFGDRVPEILPEDILTSQGFFPLTTALRGIHFPHTPEELSAARARLAFDELFFLQLLLAYRYRQVKVEMKGIRFDVKSQLARQLLNRLPFQLTSGQKHVIREIAEDMASDKPMNRLLQGDVGSGKTIVALIAMLIAVDNGYQAAFMAPTEILAEQHYRTLARFLKGLPVTVRLLIGSQSKRLHEEILEDIRSGGANIVVGTHALVQEHVAFAKLGIVVIDEQHRFGVVQRSMLREKGTNPDVLVMTATPIPRTLSLTIYGDLDVSVIREMPQGRRMVKTLLRHESERESVYEFVRSQVLQGHQAYIVYPIIEESEKLAVESAEKNFDRLRREVFPAFRMGLLHGRLSEEEKDGVMENFITGNIDILVTTTVIEVGIDVPNATVMVVESAERFGMAQLHQLRGRVGRGSEQSYCILLTKYSKHYGAVNSAYKRLQVLTQTTDGFHIAEEDLRLRGPGEFFGTRQSGLPEFRVADLVLDEQLLQRARKEAFALVERDPHLRHPAHVHLREEFERHYRDLLKLAHIG
ncbi:MAG: ATP-dependent DNA helicase RecG [Bacteroidota bacterium]